MERLKAECQIMQLLYKLREKGVITTNDMIQILQNADAEFFGAEKVVNEGVKKWD